MALESWAFVPIIFCYAFVCWYFSLSAYVVTAFFVFAILILLFCENVSNIFALIIYVSFFISDIANISKIEIIIYAVCIGIFLLVLLGLTVKLAVRQRNNFKKGGMFFAIIVSSIAFLLGGSIGFFHIENTLLVFGFCVSTLLLYLIAKNRTQNLGKYLAYAFFVGAIFIGVEICVVKLRAGNLFGGQEISDSVFFFSAQELNTASIYLLLGIIGCFELGKKSKYDVVYAFFALLLLFAVFITSCRTVIVLAIPCFITELVFIVLRSNSKRNFIWFGACLVIAVTVLSVCFYSYFIEFFKMLLDKIGRGLNGRDVLWAWCKEKFAENPIFGCGFVYSECLPTIRSLGNIILAHNTLLQWLCSLGVIGTALMTFFYVRKYKILFSRADANRLFYVLAILCVEFCGFFDQAPAMDIFTYLVPLILIGGLEQVCGIKKEPKGDKESINGNNYGSLEEEK